MKKVIVHRKFSSDWESIYQYINRGLLCRSELFLSNSLNWDKELIFDCEFNGGMFEIRSDSTVESCYSDWSTSMEQNREAYEKSEEYAQWQAERKAQTIKMNEEVGVLLKDFLELPFKHTDMNSMEKILDWLCAYQPYSDSLLCTEKDDAFVIKTLQDNGFVSNAYTNFSTYTAGEMFVYIVGQAIGTMEMVALHGMIITFVDRWKKDYLNKAI